MKGIIVEQRKGKTVVLSENGSFLSISKRKAAIGEEIVFHRGSFSATAVALCIVLLIGISLFFIPVGSVFLDVNPSICLNVNPFGYVLSAQGLNEDGKAVLEENIFFFRNVKASVKNILTTCDSKGFLNHSFDTVEIRLDEDLKINEDDLTNSLASLSSENIEISIFEISKKDSKKAKNKSIPAKRVRAISIYTEYFGGTFEENEAALLGFSSEDILNLVLGYKIENEASKEEDTSSRNENIHFSSPKRKAAIRAYTEAFGGNDAENAEVLQGVKNKEIYEIIKLKKEKNQ